MSWVILIVVVVVVIYYLNKSKTKAGAAKIYTLESPEVGKDFASEAVKFFDNYLCLCKNHSVMAVCSLLALGTDEFGVKTKMECVITAIDGEHGDEVFGMIGREWSRLRQEKMAEGDYSAVTYAGDGYIKDYFGCEDLHYAFTEADEYQFENGQAIMAFERTLFTRNGVKWEPTLSAIKQELLKRWPNANVDVGKSGIIVKK